MWMIDIDDVQADYILGMITKYGRPAQWDGGLESMWPMVDIEKHFRRSSFLANLPEVSLASKSIWEVSAHVEVVNLTARPRFTAVATMDWLTEKDFPALETVYTGGHEGKIDWLDQHKGDIEYLIEDHPLTIVAAEQMGINVLIFNCPWNAMIPDTETTQRVLGWRHIIHIFREYARFKTLYDQTT